MTEPSEKIAQLQEMYDASRSVVFFGGAGVSTESGIPDFRSVDGLYNQKWKFPPETIISRSFFDRRPAEFYEFYREKLIARDAKPNAAHKKLAEMERAGRLKAVITQNIDGLHQAAGSKCVYELHGSTLRNFCMDCRQPYDVDFILKAGGIGDGVPRCELCGGIVKPDVVLYEESLDHDCMENAVRALMSADMLIIGGTSLTVYPAAGLVRYFHGDRLVLINKSPTAEDSAAALVIHDSIGTVLARIDAR